MALSLSLLTACSEQWHEVDTGASEDEIYEALDRMQGSNEVQALGTNLITQMRDDSTNTIYFRKSANPGAVPESVFSMGDVSPIVGGNQRDVFDMFLTDVSIALIDGMVETGFGSERYFALMIELVSEAGTQYVAAMSSPGQYFFDEDEGVFEAEFQINGQTIILKTYNLSDTQTDALGATVKFDVYVLNPDGSGSPIGQFGALAGFGS